MDKLSNVQALAYLTLRLAIGMSMLGHGLARIGQVHAFVEKTAKSFADTWLPHPAVMAFLYSVPVVELGIGICVVLGIFSRSALFAGGIWMVLLIFGSTLIENYQVVGIQLIYASIFSSLLYFSASNVFSVDGYIQSQRSFARSPA
jgi:thiosulfate dehydrogenase [quinone] large subunit